MTHIHTFADNLHRNFLREVLERKGDPHQAWAAYKAGKPEHEVTQAERAAAKQENSYLLYSPAFMSTVRFSVKDL